MPYPNAWSSRYDATQPNNNISSIENLISYLNQRLENFTINFRLLRFSHRSRLKPIYLLRIHISNILAVYYFLKKF